MLAAISTPKAALPAPRVHFTCTRSALNLPPMNDAAAGEPSDESLMLAYAAGRVAAFEQLYARHRGPLYRFLARQLRNDALADELFQDIWQKVIAARASWRPEAAFSTWLFRIAHNRLNDHWRALKHRPPAPADADDRTAQVPDPHTPERTLSEFEQRRRLQMALDELPGIGPWTAEMMLIFAFDRLDVFSLGDVGLRNSINALYSKRGRDGKFKPLDEKKTLKIVAPWAPYRSVGCWYLWKQLDGPVDTWA